MRIGIITQARLGSTRLPRKVLEELGDGTVLEMHLRRLQQSGLPVYVATTHEPGVEQIIGICAKMGVPAYQGSTSDVLVRYWRCTVAHDLDVIVRVTSDCPLIDGKMIGEAVQGYLLAPRGRYLSNTVVRTHPKGFDFEIFTRSMLARATTLTSSPYEREHVTPYFYSGKDPSITVHYWCRMSDASQYNVALDTLDNLEFLRYLVDVYGADRMDCEGIIDLLESLDMDK